MCEPTQQEDFATTVRQLTDDKFDLLLQFVIEKFVVCIKGEVGIVKPFFPINGCQVFNPVLLYNGYVFQVVQASVAHHCKQQRSYGDRRK